MKMKLLLIVMLLLAAITQSLFAQPMASMRVPYRQIIISEYHPGGTTNSYAELTNVGDSTVNLKDFLWWACDQRSVLLGAANIIRDTEGNLLNAYYLPTLDMHRFWGRLKDHLLRPGESFVMTGVFDRTNLNGTLIQRERLVEKANMFAHAAENLTDSTIYKSYYPEYQNFNFDSMSAQGAARTQLNFQMFGLSTVGRTMLHQFIYNEAGAVLDSVAIDGIKLLFTPTGGGDNDVPNIAGVAVAFNNHMIVRKSNVTHGNLNWNLSAGVSAEDSEWLVIPKLKTRNIWTTIGVHGNFSPSATSTTIGIDLEGQTLTVPWGIYKINNGDSIFNYMTLGPGMSWLYLQNSQNFEGGAHSIVQEGDTLVLFTTGIALDRRNLRIIQQAPAANETRVFPMRTLDYPNPANPLDSLTWGGMPYYVTQYGTIMDTVGNITYSARVDSLFKYLEKPALATWEIIWVDGIPRVDLMNGDILKVTAENGTDTKEYYLDVLSFTPSDNAFLASITWPDKPGFMLNWAQDTIPRFNSRVTNYNIRLPYEHQGVPALQTTVENVNAKVEIFPAANVDGTAADRTTHIMVTAEDDSTVVNYYIVFNREKLAEQFWEAEPIISEFNSRIPNDASLAIELYNPGTTPIDLSNYMIAHGSNVNIQVHITAANNITEGGWMNRYNGLYIPGFKWPSTYADYQLNPGVMIFDPTVDPILEPGEAFAIYQVGFEGPTDPYLNRPGVFDLMLLSQYIPIQEWEEHGGNQWGVGEIFAQMNYRPMNANTSTYILKILNDSIQRGLKPVRDLADFEVVDLFGRCPNPSIIAGRTVNGGLPNRLIRKPHVYLPNTEQRGGFGTNAEDSDWIFDIAGDTKEGVILDRVTMALDLGYHIADEATFFRSVVFSNVYKVDDGFEGSLSISGVSGSENVEAFFNNLIKVDTGQTLAVSATAGGPAKAPADAVAENDLLTVTSADSLNQTVYTISLAPLDANNTLTLAGGSSLVLTRDGNTGSVSGFPFGTTISSVFEQVVNPVLASLSIVDAMGQLLPLSVMNTDTVKVSSVADNNVFFRVTAENGTSALYSLQPASSASDAYVLSDLYTVNQEASTIDVVPVGTAVSAFLANLKPVPGASLQVRTKTGGARNLGDLNFDDFLYVTSQDQTVTKIYFIQFIGEAEGLQTEFRTLAPAPTNLILNNVSAEGTAATIAWNHDSEMEFGFVITRNGVPVDTVVANTFTDQGLSKGATYQYSVYAYNEFGNSDAVALTVEMWPTATEQKVVDEISIYPNVTSDMIYFKNVPEESRVMLMDLTGRSILVKNASELKGGLSLQPYANGYYLIRVMKGQEYIKSVKVLKK